MNIAHLAIYPVRFLSSRAESEPGWWASFGPVLLTAAVVAASAGIVSFKSGPILTAALVDLGSSQDVGAGPPVALMAALAIVSAAVLQVLLFGLQAGAFCCVYWLQAKAGQTRLLVKLAAMSYWVQSPLWLFTIATALWFTPPPLELPLGSTTTDFPTLLERYQADLSTGTLALTSRLLNLYFGLWVVGLQSVALRVVAGCSTGTAWGVAALIGGVFVFVPWALERIS